MTSAEFSEGAQIREKVAEIAGALRGMRASVARGPGALGEELPHLIVAMEKLPTQLDQVHALMTRLLDQVASITTRAQAMEQAARRALAGRTADQDALTAAMEGLRTQVRAAFGNPREEQEGAR